MLCFATSKRLTAWFASNEHCVSAPCPPSAIGPLCSRACSPQASCKLMLVVSERLSRAAQGCKQRSGRCKGQDALPPAVPPPCRPERITLGQRPNQLVMLRQSMYGLHSKRLAVPGLALKLLTCVGRLPAGGHPRTPPPPTRPPPQAPTAALPRLLPANGCMLGVSRAVWRGWVHRELQFYYV